MSRLDLIIFGATGFTGKHAVEELVRISKNYPDLTWGIAGRNQSKLDSVLKEISKTVGEDLSFVKILIADVQDENSLKEMCSEAKVMLNCCGPYRFGGEEVVRACIETKTHYVDVSAEPEFIHSMQHKYDKEAHNAGVYIVRACGFDCIPIDAGVTFLQQNFGGTLNSVESYVSFIVPLRLRHKGVVNSGTWESLIHQMANYSKLSDLMKEMYPKELPTFNPELKPRRKIHKLRSAWCVPFPSVDASVVYSSQRYLYERHNERPAQIKTYVKLPYLILALMAFPAVFFLYIFSRCRLTRWFLLKFPGLLTLKLISNPANEEAIKATKFKFELYGEGWEAGTDVDAVPPNKKMTAKISGTNAYYATVVGLVYSALTVLKESDKMPPCGVLTPGIAFRNTNLINHLNENDFKFEILEDEITLKYDT